MFEFQEIPIQYAHFILSSLSFPPSVLPSLLPSLLSSLPSSLLLLEIMCPAYDAPGTEETQQGPRSIQPRRSLRSGDCCYKRDHRWGLRWGLSSDQLCSRPGASDLASLAPGTWPLVVSLHGRGSLFSAWLKPTPASFRARLKS